VPLPQHADHPPPGESAALRLPLAEVRAMLAAAQLDLADSLNTFNEVYLSDTDQDESDTLTQAIGAVARRATVTAIFALGLNQRTCQAAHHN
jgi:hypothetical protein